MKKKPSKELNKIQEATTQIVANKIYVDYSIAMKTGSIEPESFCELWINKNLIKPKLVFRQKVWHWFIQRLIDKSK